VSDWISHIYFSQGSAHCGFARFARIAHTVWGRHSEGPPMANPNPIP